MQQFFRELQQDFKDNPKSSVFFDNIFSFREIGNKTHGDMTEILLDHYINKYLSQFSSKHIGKEKFRAKESEEDLEVYNKKTKRTFFLSLKNYGDNGPLQIRTDKNNQLFGTLSAVKNNNTIQQKQRIVLLLQELLNINVLCFLYNEKEKHFRVCVINTDAIIHEFDKVQFINKGKGRKHPIYQFLDSNGTYIFEVRYGSATANALQRGIWTNTKKSVQYLQVLFEGDYRINYTFLEALKELSFLDTAELNTFLRTRC